MYYKMLEGGKGAECIQCRKKLSSSNKGNLVRHYKLVHNRDIVLSKKRQQAIISLKISKKLKNSSNKSNAEVTHDEELIAKKHRQSPDPCIGKSKNIAKINMGRNQFLKCCIGLVTVKNMPLQLFDDSEFFKTLILPYENLFKTNLNSQNIGKVLESATNKFQDIIRNKIKNRMISLKVDIVKRMGQSILALNIQYINNSKIFTNTLGILKLQKQHNTMALKEELFKCLRKYDIELKQIYSTTTDNGSNFHKFNQILQELQVKEIYKNYTKEYDDNFAEIDYNIEKCLKPLLPFLPCAVRVIEFAANDVMKTLLEPIAAWRQAYTIVRANSEKIEFPELDNSVRWKCVYEMMQSVLYAKDFIDSGFLDKLDISINWAFVSDFVLTFTPLARCMDLLEKEKYVVGDFYRDWLNCELELEDISSPIALKLYNAMQNRKKIFLENDAFVAALYLDPRFNFTNSTIMSHEEKSRALEHLVKTFDVIRDLEHLMENSLLTEFVQNSSFDEIDEPCTSSTPYAKLERRIMTSTLNRSISAAINLTFAEKLTNFCNTRMVPLDTDILEYFASSPLDPDVFKVLNVALAVPVNQISVQRSFNALALTLINLKNNLDDVTLNNIIITKLNFDEVNYYNEGLDFSHDDELNSDIQ